MPFPVGNHPAGGPSITQAVFRDSWQAGETISYPITNVATAATYEVRNFSGVIVASGTVTGTPLVLPTLPLGWYKLYVTKTTTSAAPWNNYGDERCFCVVRSNADSPLVDRPAINAAEQGDPGDAGHDFPARGFFGVGPARHKLWALDNTNTVQATDGIVNDCTIEASRRVVDSARPFQPIAGVPQGYNPGVTAEATNLTTSVQRFVGAGGVWMEGRNEPNTGIGPTLYATEQNAFADVVHAAHASAKVLGPSTIQISGVLDNEGTSLGWLNTILPLVSAKLDGISFHNYDSSAGDLAVVRRDFDNFIALLTKYGLHTKPRFNTEFGSQWAAAAGSFEPHWQAKHIMFELHVHEQYGIPKERCYLFYDLNMGFWSFPAFWLMKEGGFGQPTALAPLMRTWAEELFGRTFAARLNFGSEDNLWMGSRFDASDGSSVVVLQSSGHVGSVTLTVSGATSVVTSDCWGNLTTRTVTGGVVSVPVDEMPAYVRCPAGVSAVPVAVDHGVDVLRSPNSTYTASNQATLAPLAFNGEQSLRNDEWLADTGALPATITATFPAAKRFNRVVVVGPSPHNGVCALTDFDVQALISGVWTTVATATELTTFKVWTSGNAAGGCYVDSFYSRRSQWMFRLAAPVSATGVRLYIRATSYGGAGTNESFQGNPNVGGEIGQGGPPRPQVREIRVSLNEYDQGMGPGVPALPR